MSQDERYIIISTDGHAGADLYEYKPYLEKKYHEDFDRWAATYNDAWGDIEETAPDNIRMGVASFDLTVNWDSDARQKYLEEQGVAAEILYPNTSPPFYPSAAVSAPGPRTQLEYEQRFAGLKAHNRWLADFCAATPGRRAGLAQIFLNDVDASIEEVIWAKEHGLMGISLPADHHLLLSNLYYPEYDKLWAVCEDIDIPVHRHGVLVGESEGSPAGVNGPALGALESLYFAQRPLGHMIIAGVFERYPKLKFVMTELGSSWAVPYLAELDGFYEASRVAGTYPGMFAGKATAKLSKKPSEYFRSNVFIGTFFSPADIRTRNELGIDRLMWGGDFPHHEGVSDLTLKALRSNFAGLPRDEVLKLTSENAAACYGFDLDFLRPIADRIGPKVADVDQPLVGDEIPRYPQDSICPTFIPEEAWVS